MSPLKGVLLIFANVLSLSFSLDGSGFGSGEDLVCDLSQLCTGPVNRASLLKVSPASALSGALSFQSNCSLDCTNTDVSVAARKTAINIIIIWMPVCRSCVIFAHVKSYTVLA